jgi:acyl transferase domain-containing protein
VVLGVDREELLASLNALSQGAESAAVARGRTRGEQRPVFLFPGQGAQAAGMASGLIDFSPAFAAHIAACEQALAPHVEWSLTEVLADLEAGWLGRLDVVQPALFAVMVSLARLWRECGIEPAAVVGHSQGEIAAAHVAGALSLDDAALIVAKRAQAMTKIAGEGGMLSVSLSPAQLTSYLEQMTERVSLAAINGPASLVLSGDAEALKEVQSACEADGVWAQAIAVDYAAHSAQIDALEEELLEAFAPISPRSSKLPMHSTVVGKQIDTAEMGPAYWYRNLRQAVLLEPVLRSLIEGGRRTFVEIGPHPVLAFGVEETIEEVLEAPGEAKLLFTLRREEEDVKRFALSLAEAHANGFALDWTTFFKGSAVKRVPLPTYPFQREHYWFDFNWGGQGETGADGQAAGQQPLLGPVNGQVEGLQLVGIPAEEREAAVLDFSRAQIAAILGHSDAAGINPDRPFVELGVDSVSAMEIRNRLAAATEVRIPVSVLSTQPTVRQLAKYVARRLDPSAGGEDQKSPQTFVSLLASARQGGEVGEFIDLLGAASRYRASFDRPPGPVGTPSPVRLAEGADAPSLVLMPSLVAMSGPQEYVRLARGFRGERSVEVLPLPGFADDEALPASLDVFIEAAADRVMQSVVDSDFALAGYSSGGWVAHAVAERLEARGAVSRAVVLLDTPWVSVDTSKLLELVPALEASQASELYIPLDDARLTAMARYFELFDGWMPGSLEAAVSMVRASEPLDGVSAQIDELERALSPNTTIEVPGNHFTMMWEHADKAMQAVQHLIEPSKQSTEERQENAR